MQNQKKKFLKLSAIKTPLFPTIEFQFPKNNQHFYKASKRCAQISSSYLTVTSRTSQNNYGITQLYLVGVKICL